MRTMLSRSPARLRRSFAGVASRLLLIAWAVAGDAPSPPREAPRPTALLGRDGKVSEMTRSTSSGRRDASR